MSLQMNGWISGVELRWLYILHRTLFSALAYVDSSSFPFLKPFTVINKTILQPRFIQNPIPLPSRDIASHPSPFSFFHALT